VPLAVIIYWVTTNFWSVGQQYMLLRSAPVPAGADLEAAPAAAPALVDDGESRKGLGPLSLFRGLSPSRAAGERPPASNKNGNRNAKAGGSTKATGSAKPSGSTKATGNTKAGGGKAAPKQGGSAAKGAQARPGPAGRQGTSGNRRSGSRSSGKGKSSGPRRGKR
jgi:YidC/Oxa1 family membrane protein insertase